MRDSKASCEHRGCSKKIVRGLVVCFEHASRDVLTRRIKQLENENKELRQWMGRVQRVVNTTVSEGTEE